MSDPSEYRDLLRAIDEEFAAADGPATVRDVAELYKLFIIQQEAVVQLFSLVGQSAPSVIFTDTARHLNDAIAESSNLFSASIKRFAEEHGRPEDGSA